MKLMYQHFRLLAQSILLLLSLGYANDNWALTAIDETPSVVAPQSVERKIMQQEMDLRTEMDAQQAIEETEYSFATNLRKLEMVNLSGGITMSKYEITQGLWQAVMGDNPARFINCGEQCPVENVSWNEVQAFLGKLNAKTGKQYRLPSETEWLSACKAGGVTEYCGSNDIDSIAWFADNSAAKTHPVGQKKPNAWGLYDMSGNVSEWTKSCLDNNCTQRVICGGSWLNSKSVVSVTARDWLNASLRNSRLGFRLVLDR